MQVYYHFRSFGKHGANGVCGVYRLDMSVFGGQGDGRMQPQGSFPQVEYTGNKKQARRDKSPAAMERVIPLGRPVAQLQPPYPKREHGRPLIKPERIYASILTIRNRLRHNKLRYRRLAKDAAHTGEGSAVSPKARGGARRASHPIHSIAAGIGRSVISLRMMP